MESVAEATTLSQGTSASRSSAVGHPINGTLN